MFSCWLWENARKFCVGLIRRGSQLKVKRGIVTSSEKTEMGRADYGMLMWVFSSTLEEKRSQSWLNQSIICSCWVWAMGWRIDQLTGGKARRGFWQVAGKPEPKRSRPRKEAADQVIHLVGAGGPIVPWKCVHTKSAEVTLFGWKLNQVSKRYNLYLLDNN